MDIKDIDFCVCTLKGMLIYMKNQIGNLAYSTRYHFCAFDGYKMQSGRKAINDNNGNCN